MPTPEQIASQLRKTLTEQELGQFRKAVHLLLEIIFEIEDRGTVNPKLRKPEEDE